MGRRVVACPAPVQVGESDLRRSLILNTTPRQFAAEAAFSWALTVVIGLLNGVVSARGLCMCGVMFVRGLVRVRGYSAMCHK